MTFEEAKQKVAESKGCNSFTMLLSQGDNFDRNVAFTEAAELWQQSNLERIKVLEEAKRITIILMRRRLL